MTNERQRDGELIRVLDAFTRPGGIQISDADLASVACLSALIGSGLHLEADGVAKAGGQISRGDALAAMGLLLVENIGRIGPEVESILKRIRGES